MTPFGGMMKVTVITPAPHDFETKSEYHARLNTHSGMVRAYPTLFKRHVAGEKRWAKAKADSLVSIKTSVDEALLFGGLN